MAENSPLRGAHAVCDNVRKVASRGVTQIILELPIEFHVQAVMMFDGRSVWVEPAPGTMAELPYAIVDTARDVAVPSHGQENDHLPATPGPVEDKTPLTQSKEVAAKEVKPYGKQASLLYKAGFFLNPVVLRFIGSDAGFLEWIRHQPCAVTGEFDYSKDEATGETREQCEAAHYRSIEGGAGMGIKPEYSAIPLRHVWHQAQTERGYGAFAYCLRNCPGGMDDETAGRLWMERRKNHYVTEWASHKLAEGFFDKTSMGYVNPRDVHMWAANRGIEHWLPAEYKS
jgi:hypothetical protein